MDRWTGTRLALLLLSPSLLLPVQAQLTFTAGPASTTTTTSPTPSTLSTSPSPSSSSTTSPTVPIVPTPTPTASCTSVDCPGNSSGNTFAYYYVLIAVFFILLAAVLWYGNRRRKMRLAHNAQSSRSALARDMQNREFGETYPNNRRWLGRRYGPEDGLDEQGFAPPPYKPETGRDPSDEESGIAMPMQALHRDGTTKPPDYLEHYSPPETPAPDSTTAPREQDHPATQ